jgi:hypothetical protein
MGVAHDGGYAEHVRVPADWVVRRPESMTAFDAMTLGTAGYTAALAIHLMEHNGLKPENGPVAVTGATGGVGSVAVEILAKLGYHVVAITGKGEESDYLRSIGAKESCCGSRSTSPRSARSIARTSPAPSTTSAATSCRGSCRRRRSAAPWAVGALRRLQALDDRDAVHPARRAPASASTARDTPMALRQTIWNKLAVEWRPDRVHDQVRTIDFDELPTHFDPYLKGLVRGRTVVRIGSDTHP